MQITTMKGNKSTTPRGTETAELPFNRRGRLKNAHLEVLFLLPASFIVGRSDAVGKRFIARRTTSIAAKNERGPMMVLFVCGLPHQVYYIRRNHE
jgi:hypothetical protein